MDGSLYYWFHSGFKCLSTLIPYGTIPKLGAFKNWGGSIITYIILDSTKGNIFEVEK